jgi:hypothetical protein
VQSEAREALEHSFVAAPAPCFFKDRVQAVLQPLRVRRLWMPAFAAMTKRYARSKSGHDENNNPLPRIGGEGIERFSPLKKGEGDTKGPLSCSGPFTEYVWPRGAALRP